MARKPEERAARWSYTSRYVIHWYSRGVPSGSTVRHPNAGLSLLRLHVLSHRSCRVFTPSWGGANPVISLVYCAAFLLLFQGIWGALGAWVEIV
jgi:hypothetical protein